MESLKHLLGLCGENHGLLYMFFAFGAFIFTAIKFILYTIKWWIQDNIF